MRPGHEYECYSQGADDHKNEIVRVYPKKEGMKTRFITGNHDASFVKLAGLQIGQMISRDRDDMDYLGQDSAVIRLTDNCVLELRQWINSNAAANAWWQPSNIFDRPPSYANVAGFVNGLPADFVDVLGAVDIDVIRNTIYEVDGVKGGSYTLRDKFFLPSMTELGLGNNNSIAEGSVLAYYANATQADRIKYDIASSATARYWRLRSPYPSVANSVRHVLSDGALGSGSAYDGYGAAPACVIM